jgi:DNA polymerase III epsilon subunit-like protein
MDNLIFVDVETTGLNSAIHEIIEIAIIGEGIHYHEKIDPIHIEHASPKALEINGYTPEKWKDAIPPKQAAIAIAKLIEGKTIVGHNVRFDIEFIEELLNQHGIYVFYDRRLIDTVTLAHEHLIPCGIKSISMDAIRGFFGWSDKGAHTALKDALDCRRLYFKISKSSKLQRLIWTHKKKIKHLLKMII